MNELRATIVLWSLLTFLLGGLYPSALWLAGRLIFPVQSRGSLLDNTGEITGSALIGQNFTSPRYFWPRPSATVGSPYQFFASGASNLSVTNPHYVKTIKERAAALRASNNNNDAPVPIDLVTASASGLDPHISVQAAQYQVDRIAAERKIRKEILYDLIDLYTEHSYLRLWNESYVNVLVLNLALSRMDARTR